ncbi:hypothetical protein [Fluviicola taffensis]|uniref:HNH endonuclease n=1 Tax=Fluviicola taffensis TaxID=191579 RepID=UPI003137B70E
MINLSLNRDLKTMSENFYKLIESELVNRLDDQKTYFNSFQTKSKEHLGDYLEKNLKTIIIGELDFLIKNIKPELDEIFKTNYKTIAKKPTPFKSKIDRLLFFEEHDKWNAYSFTQQFKLSCCPYCNRTYITTLGETKNKFFRPDIDHFLAKSKYGYLRFSFFNLIPSCVICNRNAKGRKETSLTKNAYPYKEGFGNLAKFNYLPSPVGLHTIYFDFFCSKAEIKKLNSNIDLFKLKEQYSTHYLEIDHLKFLHDKFNDTYIEDLMTNYPGIIKDKKEAYLIAFGKEYDLINDEKRPLSKFTRDIAENMGLLKYMK